MPVIRFSSNPHIPNNSKNINGSVIDKMFSDRLINTDGGLNQIKKFNRFRYFDRENTLPGAKYYIFFTRPDCYIFSNRNSLRPDAYRVQFFDSLVNNPVGLSDHVIKDLQFTGMDHATPFYPLLSNMATGYTPVDDELESVEVGTTWHENKIVYGRHNLKSRTAGTASITFVDNINLHVLKALRGLYEYIEAVSLGIISPRESHVFESILDYPMSMYYIGTELDGETIIYCEKVTGLFPLNVPNSIFTMKENSNNSQETIYNIQFRYSMRSKGMDPYILYELNQLTNSGTGSSIEKTFGKGLVDPLMDREGNGISMVMYPVVYRDTNKSSQTYNSFKLGWMNKAPARSYLNSFTETPNMLKDSYYGRNI